MGDRTDRPTNAVTGTVWSMVNPDWGGLYLRRTHYDDLQAYASRPYFLHIVDWEGLPIHEIPLALEQLRSLHRQLTDELAIVATQGRWPGRGGQGRRRDDRP